MSHLKRFKRRNIKTLLLLIIFFISIMQISEFNNSIYAKARWVKNARGKWVKAKRGPKTFALNFKDVELQEFINIMSQLTGKNIIISDKVRGKISISSAKKIPLSQALQIMKSILEVKGLAVIETKNLIKIIPIKDAIKKNVEIIIDGKKTKISKQKDETITYILEIKKAEASDIASALKTLKSKFTDIVLHKPLNMLIFSGKSNEINGLLKIARALDKIAEEDDIEETGPKKVRGNIHIVNLENADASKLAEVLSRIPFSETAKINKAPIPKKTIRKSAKSKRIAKSHGRRTSKKSKLSIIANKETNSLIITATPDEFKIINSIIRKLDIVREQVLIEALIVEVSIDNGWGLGIDWMLGNQSGNHLYGGSGITGTPDYSNMTMNGKQLVVPFAQGFQLGYLSDTSILGFALLNASASNSNVNILSTPQILTIDNEEAELNVGEEIPVPTNNRISESGTQFYTYDYKSVGVKLKITPHITNKNKITLDLYQEINSVLGETIDPQKPPKLGKRDFKTKITVMNGKTIVIGGLIKNNKSVTITKVPILGDIPLLGWFFKHKTVSYNKTNLLVFITPHIMTKQSVIDRITEEKKNSQKRLRKY